MGAGPAVVLVHGGAGPGLTWERQQTLARRWTLVIPSRRGYTESPPAERQDFAIDADDLESLIEDGAHLVGFSYGGLGAAIAAGRRPRAIRSLALVEVPLFGIAPDDPAVRGLIELSDSFFRELRQRTGGASRREFLAMAAMAAPELEEERERVERLARDLRRPIEADPDYGAIVDARLPTLVLSGDHHPGLERLCDLVAGRLRARRERLGGAGHAVPRAPGFNDLLEKFWREAERADP
jgi:pimeloyl-ACP methyl ester carboxylesterase